MITDKEILLHALLAYSNFEKSDIEKNLYELFKKRILRLHSNVFETLKEKNKSFFLNFFEKELNEWKVFYIDDRRYKNKKSSKTSYYSVCFKNSENLYVLAYRGSEIYPLEEAYPDFIQTDLVFGVGFIPEQFYEGVETYNYIINKYNLEKDNISLTGHSLGGGIAQFVAVSNFIENSYVTAVKTFNSIGINRKHMFKEKKLNNDLFKNKIINYGHSKDFTNTIFKHFGRSIKLDKNFINIEIEKEIFLDKIEIFNKAIYNYHHEDVFIPFLNEDGNLENKINLKFIASSIRKILTKENLFENKFLALYFSEKKLGDVERKYIKTSILKALKDKKTKILYKKQISFYIEKLEEDEIKEFYEVLKNKMPSIYEKQDIFDLLVFK